MIQERGLFSGKSLIRSLAIWASSVGLYLLLAWWLNKQPYVESLTDRLELSEAGGWAAFLFVVILSVFLLVPLSSGTFLVLLGVDLFGSGFAFILSLTGGVVASIISYWCGRVVQRLLPSLTSPGRLNRALRALTTREAALWWSIFLLRAIPNPLYDVWGYAAGILRVKFGAYLAASFLGGSIPVSILCFLVPRLH